MKAIAKAAKITKENSTSFDIKEIAFKKTEHIAQKKVLPAKALLVLPVWYIVAINIIAPITIKIKVNRWPNTKTSLTPFAKFSNPVEF